MRSSAQLALPHLVQRWLWLLGGHRGLVLEGLGLGILILLLSHPGVERVGPSRPRLGNLLPGPLFRISGLRVLE